MELVKEPSRKIIRRSLDERKLEIGDAISIKEGVVGIVLACYLPAGKGNEICYIVELLSDSGEKGEP